MKFESVKSSLQLEQSSDFRRQQRRCARFEQAASADLFCKRNFGTYQVLRRSSTPSFEAPVRSRIGSRSATAGWTPRNTASRTRVGARRTSHRPGTLRLIDGTPLGRPMSTGSELKIGRNEGAPRSSPDALKHLWLALARATSISWAKPDYLRPVEVKSRSDKASGRAFSCTPPDLNREPTD